MMPKVEPRPPEPRIGLITLGVQSLDRAIEFYQHGLCWPRLEEDDAKIAFFTLQGTWLALYGWNALAEDVMVNAGGEGFRGVTLAYMARDVDEVNAVLAQAKAAGGTLLKPGQQVVWGGYSGYFADPDGHLWEVAHHPSFWPGPSGKPGP
ncbi:MULTISPECIES: VOC family protein [Halomonas]|uniref:VOC family protein n=1 Tax=Halomonas TaxID=2745 RepID=UPI001CD65146|nr:MULTISPECIES: VOC family protein [Halomonas]MCA0917286.1 VOC family protein [Halomonas denitrificans]